MEPASSLSPGLKIPPAPRQQQSGPRVTARRISPLCSKYHTPYHTHFTKNPRWRVSKIQLTRIYALSPLASPTRPPGHSPTIYNCLTTPRSKAPRSPTVLAQLPSPAPGHLQLLPKQETQLTTPASTASSADKPPTSEPPTQLRLSIGFET